MANEVLTEVRDRVLLITLNRPDAMNAIDSALGQGVVAAVKRARPDLPAYWVVSLNPKKGTAPPTAERLIARAKEIRADGLDLSAADALDAAFAGKVRAAGLKLYVWTVNDAIVARRMVDLGVDGITTDRPGWLRERLAR